MKRKDSTSESHANETEPAASSDELENITGHTDISSSPADVTNLDQPVPPSSPEQDDQTQSLSQGKGLSFMLYIIVQILLLLCCSVPA